jgi:PAS domain S-box-containing protein
MKTKVISKYAWVPIPLFLLLILAFSLSGDHYSYENTFVRVLFNLIFNTLVSVFIIHILSRIFLRSGKAGVVLISCGVIFWGFAGISPLFFGRKDVNTLITVYNICVCLSALFNTAGAAELATKNRKIKVTGFWLTVIYFAATAIIAIVVLSAFYKKTPVFFINEEGGTTIRILVLWTSIILFVITGLILRSSAREFLNRFAYWYSLALWLIAIGIAGVMLSPNLGDLLNWTGRSAQFLGGIYMTVAALSSAKETNTWGLSIEYELGKRNRQTEDALRKTEDKYRRIVELAGESLIITNDKFVIKEWNRAATELYGWSTEEAIGKSLVSILGSAKPEREVRKMVDEGRSATVFEDTRRKKDGSIILTESRISTMKDENGMISGYIGLSHDITERKKTEEELIKTREELSMAYAEAEHRRQELFTIFQDAPVAIWIAHDPECRTITGNKYANEFIMRVPTEANVSASATNAAIKYSVSRNGVVLKPDELPAQVAIATGKPVQHHVLQLNFDDGRKIHLLEGAVPQFDKYGNITGAIIVGIDITTQVNAETSLRESEAALIEAKEELEQSGDKLQLSLENTNTGIWEWNLATDEVTWDERMEKMFDIIPGTFNGTFKAFAELVNEEDLKHVEESIRRAIENDIPYETVFRTRSVKNERYISARAKTNKDKDGRNVSLTGVCFDVTGMMERYNHVIASLNEDLLKSNRELESFAYVASHDLQEPLRMVTSFTQLLQLRYHDKLDEDANTYINYAVDGSKRMYELLNGLLAYSRVNTRQKEFTDVDMNLMVQNVADNLKIKIEESGAVLKYDNLPVIRADQNQMVQLLQNLIDNGIKFSRELPVITLSSVIKNGHHVISVSDNGIGIEQEYFDRIFRIFQRLHLKSEYGGMGIGLSICQRIVERHKGKIWVESEPGKGSTFLFSIPI